MHSDKPLSLKVYEWLQKQGYPLEMEVASALSKKGLWVRRAESLHGPGIRQVTRNRCDFYGNRCSRHGRTALRCGM